MLMKMLLSSVLFDLIGTYVLSRLTLRLKLRLAMLEISL